jgi:hypothetical protein
VANGADADLVVISPQLSVVETFCHGGRIFKATK